MDEAWLGIADVPYGGAPDDSGVVGAHVVVDTDLPSTTGFAGPVRVSISGGAGQVGGPCALAGRLGLDLVAVDVALRDLDNLPGNAQRVVAAVDAARSEGALGEDVPVYVEVPDTAGQAGWLYAVDELAAAELRLGFPGAPSATLARWIDAALDRETAYRFAHDLPGAAFVQALVATRVAFDGGSVDEVAQVLDGLDQPEMTGSTGLSGARRWFTSYAATSAAEPLETLRELGLA
jgi:hypothetical protein